MMMKLRSIAILGLLLAGSSGTSWAIPPYDPADPRPDLFPHPIYNTTSSYRAVYNRPRYLGGYLAYVVEPSSQEAMAWHENKCNGYYGTRIPTPVRTYWYPKPWEAMNTGPRLDPALVEKYRAKKD